VNRTSLLIRSFAKVNLALAVLERRPDAYHEIRTVFQSIDLCDEIEFYPSARLELECENLPGIPVPGNLVWKAALAFAESFAPGRGASIRLRKKIPIGGGLGGGSSNAAATLIGLNRFWQLGVENEDLHKIAAKLGADVPFFLHGGTALGIGRGDEIYPLPQIGTENLVLIFPGINISTAEAYQSLRLVLTPVRAALKMQGFCGRLISEASCPAGIFNDFETSILPAYAEIREAKEFLINHGATGALLSGSGSSVFGFFREEESALAVSQRARRETWRVFPAKTLSSAEYLHRMIG
jgi:4-diphosphocytidyl-2-C-methyl-D-erythritol kinase